MCWIGAVACHIPYFDMVLSFEHQPHPLPSFPPLLPFILFPVAFVFLICPSLLRIFDSAACAGMCVYAFRVIPDCASDCASDCVACARMCGNAIAAFVELHGHVHATVRHVPACAAPSGPQFESEHYRSERYRSESGVARRRLGACSASCYPARAADAALRRQSGRRP